MEKLFNHQSDKRIMTTNNYALFKFLSANRDVSPSHVNAIKESIRETGYVTRIITVNEKLEILDGQHGFCACRELGLPIEYVIHEGGGIKECIALNLKQNNWTTMDFVQSYAKQGNLHYIKLLEVIKKYEAIPAALIEKVLVGSFSSTTTQRVIRYGEFLFPEVIEDNLYKMLDYIQQFQDLLPFMPKGARRFDKTSYYRALMFCYTNKAIDNDRLMIALMKAEADLENFNFSNVISTIKAFNKAYNKNVPYGKRVHIDRLYEDYINLVDAGEITPVD